MFLCTCTPACSSLGPKITLLPISVVLLGYVGVQERWLKNNSLPTKWLIYVFHGTEGVLMLHIYGIWGNNPTCGNYSTNVSTRGSIPLLVIVPLQSVLLKRHKGKPERKGQMAVVLSYRGSFLGRSRKQRQYVF